MVLLSERLVKCWLLRLLDVEFLSFVSRKKIEKAVICCVIFTYMNPLCRVQLCYCMCPFSTLILLVGCFDL